jgi:hypothetical protein
MPAFNMGGTAASNPSAGHAVLMSPFSGPKGSPFDAKRADYSNPASMTRVADTANLSTGGLSTGIGFGLDVGLNDKVGRAVIPPDFTDDYTPGVTMPAGTAATLAVLTTIGGGKSGNDANATPAPYVAQPLLGFGNGGARDAGAGPAFTGFGMKMVTATGAVANGAAIETGFLNRSGAAMVSGMSEFGSSTTASPAVT